MWLLADDGRTMEPLLDQSHLEVAWHAGQYQALPAVYVQNSALEIAWTRVVAENGTREGSVRRALPHAGPRGLQRRRRGGLGARRAPRRDGGARAACGHVGLRILRRRERRRPTSGTTGISTGPSRRASAADEPRAGIPPSADPAAAVGVFRARATGRHRVGHGRCSRCRCARRTPRTALLGLELSRTGVELAQRRVPDAAFHQVDLSRRVATASGVRVVGDARGVLRGPRARRRPGDARLRTAVRDLAPGCLLVVTVPGGPMTDYDRHIGRRKHFEADELRRLLAGDRLRSGRARRRGVPGVQRVPAPHARARRAASSRSRARASLLRSRVSGCVHSASRCAAARLSSRGWQIVAVARLPGHGPAFAP